MGLGANGSGMGDGPWSGTVVFGREGPGSWSLGAWFGSLGSWGLGTGSWEAEWGFRWTGIPGEAAQNAIIPSRQGKGKVRIHPPQAGIRRRQAFRRPLRAERDRGPGTRGGPPKASPVTYS